MFTFLSHRGGDLFSITFDYLISGLWSVIEMRAEVFFWRLAAAADGDFFIFLLAVSSVYLPGSESAMLSSIWFRFVFSDISSGSFGHVFLLRAWAARQTSLNLRDCGFGRRLGLIS